MSFWPRISCLRFFDECKLRLVLCKSYNISMMHRLSFATKFHLRLSKHLSCQPLKNLFSSEIFSQGLWLSLLPYYELMFVLDWPLDDILSPKRFGIQALSNNKKQQKTTPNKFTCVLQCKLSFVDILYTSVNYILTLISNFFPYYK